MSRAEVVAAGEAYTSRRDAVRGLRDAQAAMAGVVAAEDLNENES